MTPEERVRIHEEIFQLVYNGGGGFTHDEVYSMPIAIRVFNIRMIVLQRQREKEASEKQSNTNTVVPKPVVRPIIKKP